MTPECPHCGTPITEHEATRCLDAWVAEAVTGWEADHYSEKCNGTYFIRCGACGQQGHGNCYGRGIDTIQIKCGENTACCDEAWMPEYSQRIEDAWRVVEHIRCWGDLFIEWWQDGEWFISNLDLRTRHDGLSQDEFVRAQCDGKATGSPSAPLAICRFAILLENRWQ